MQIAERVSLCRSYWCCCWPLGAAQRRREGTERRARRSRPAGLDCGAPFEPATGGILTVTGRFPTAVSASEQMVTGTVVVAANGSEARGVVTPQAEAFLVRDGRVVTLPMPQDSVGRKLELAGGMVQRMPTMATLVPCSGGEVLPTGTYDLYVRVVLNLDDGSRADSIGGPWPLEVR
jgi:hypothetical protein